MLSHTYSIPEGNLYCHFHDIAKDYTPSDLFAVVSRNNPKRQFLFASTVLCRHLPARPSHLRMACRVLAIKLPKPEHPVLFVGFAETATALGAIFMEESGYQDLYLCTTRHNFPLPVLAQTIEAHSHAPSHTLYVPDYDLSGTWDLVLIDDEFTTAKTAETLCVQLRQKVDIASVTYASFLDWTGKPDHISLCTGDCYFEGDMRHPLPDSPCAEEIRLPPKGSWGRFGMQKHRLPYAVSFHAGDRVLCIGSGEYALDAFLAAEKAEAAGCDAYCCATTRSPIRMGETITRVFQFRNEFGRAYHEYLYNVDPDEYDRILFFPETDNFDRNLIQYLGNHVEIVM